MEIDPADAERIAEEKLGKDENEALRRAYAAFDLE